MNPAIAAIMVAVVGVIGAVLGSFVSALLNKDKHSAETKDLGADTAEKISAAWSPAFERMDKDLERAEKQCMKCEKKLEATEARLLVTERHMQDFEDDARRMKAALRALIGVIDSGDSTQLKAAITAAQQLI
jgi:gas vesicle protein